MKTSRIRVVTPATTLTALVLGVTTGPLVRAEEKVEEKVEQKGWENTASAGATLTRGNSHSVTATLGIDSVRKWSHDEMILGARAGYGDSRAVSPNGDGNDRTITTDRYIKGFAQWNHLFNERLYGGVRLDAVSDDIADIDYRVNVGPLVGYYFIKDPRTTLSAEIGPGWTLEKQTGEGAKGYLTARLGERYEHKFENGARIWQTAEIVPQLDDFDNYVLTVEVGVEAPITKTFSVQVKAVDVYDNDPAAGRLKNDFKMIAGLAYKF